MPFLFSATLFALSDQPTVVRVAAVLVLLAFTLLVLTAHLRYRIHERAITKDLKQIGTPGSKIPDRPKAFGYKCSWIAVRSEQPAVVAEAMQLSELCSCNWETGIAAAYAYRRPKYAFVSPPIDGWTLVVCFGLPWFDNPERTAQLRALLDRLASRFPEVQYFSTHRVVEANSWVRIVNQEWVRAFAFLGEADALKSDIGAIDPAEDQLRKKARIAWTKYALPDAPFAYSADEDDVMAMAAAWSIDPSEIESRNLPPGLGLVGKLSIQ